MQKQYILTEEESYQLQQRVLNIERYINWISSDMKDYIEPQIIVSSLDTSIPQIISDIKCLKRDFVDEKRVYK